MPRKEAEEIRDLERQLRDLAAGHPAYCMTHEILRMTYDHLLAKARVIEINNDDQRP